MFIRSLSMESRKRFARDGFDTFATHVCLVYDITDTDSMAQNGSFDGRVFGTFILIDCSQRIREIK